MHKKKRERSRAPSAKTDFSLFIIESLDFDDERNGRLEGKILGDLLRLSRQGIDTEYLYIRTWQEFKEALKLSKRSNKRYLHISSHGNHNEVVFTLDSVPFDEFARELVPYVRHRRIFFLDFRKPHRRGLMLSLRLQNGSRERSGQTLLNHLVNPLQLRG